MAVRPTSDFCFSIEDGQRRSRAEGFCALSPLGKGRVTDDGYLHCPAHAAMYDVGSGAMVRGPQGAFKPLAGAVQGDDRRPVR